MKEFIKIWIGIIGCLLPIIGITVLTINLAFKFREYFNLINSLGVAAILLYITGALAYTIKWII